MGVSSSEPIVPIISSNGQWITTEGKGWSINIRAIAWIQHQKSQTSGHTYLVVRLLDNSSDDNSRSVFRPTGESESWPIDTITTASMPSEYYKDFLEKLHSIK